MARIRMTPTSTGALLALVAVISFGASSRAGINSLSDGTDGAFTPTTSVEIDLSQAVAGAWDLDNTANAGKGVYDPVKWAVVYKFASINIPAGVTVTFKNHPSGAPVVWLVQGDATIAGTVNLNGKSGESIGTQTEAGPGGFGGGAGLTQVHFYGAGNGPGGGPIPTSGYFFATGGSYGTFGSSSSYQQKLGPTYGNPSIIPLIGGSGGTGRSDNPTSGGGGGGALLLAAGGTVAITGAVTAHGGGSVNSHGGGGAGGAIRIIADTFSGGGTIGASGGGSANAGGAGRIRIECNNLLFTGSVSPGPSYVNPLLSAPAIWPPADVPTVVIAEIAGAAAPSDPFTGLVPGHYAPLDVAPSAPFTVRLNAANVPLDWNVLVRVVPVFGRDFSVTATKVSGDATASVWEAQVTVPSGVYSMQARASKP